MTNCPNCGAVKKGKICEYCGTVFEDNNDITIDLNIDPKTIVEAVLDFKGVAHKFGSKIIR